MRLKSQQMKKIAISFIFVCYAAVLHAQNKNIEQEIRALEQTEVKAVLEKDSAMLLKLWDKNFVVNNPENMVVFPGTTTLDRPVLRQPRGSFDRVVEHVIVRDDVVFSMGNETVGPLSKDNVSGPPIKRRYTHVWMKENDTWKLVARHANVICPNK